MGLLSREAILGAEDLPSEQVTVPEWGGDVRVRSLTGTERDAFEQTCYTGRGADRKENFSNLRARLVALAVVDDEGKRVFADNDVLALGRKSAAALDRVFSVAQRLNGLSPSDVRDLAGNSEPGPSAATS